MQLFQCLVHFIQNQKLQISQLFMFSILIIIGINNLGFFSGKAQSVDTIFYYFM
jgi:hypothetical protein